MIGKRKSTPLQFFYLFLPFLRPASLHSILSQYKTIVNILFQEIIRLRNSSIVMKFWIHHTIYFFSLKQLLLLESNLIHRLKFIINFSSC